MDPKLFFIDWLRKLISLSLKSFYADVLMSQYKKVQSVMQFFSYFFHNINSNPFTFLQDI